ncbi:MAG: hypothetical protein QMB19_02215, partial [Burkholderiaceae bacterium]
WTDGNALPLHNGLKAPSANCQIDSSLGVSKFVVSFVPKHHKLLTTASLLSFHHVWLERNRVNMLTTT